uniref:NAC protein n=1 Tax=Lilium pumilum TaxID=82327 RepID=A0A4Y1NZZ9_9LILI|nr:NAC protein [Lilium pumilum]
MADHENTHLPPGFRFFPSDEELVVHFLYRKATQLPCRPNIIPSLDLHYCDPWELNGKALQGGNQWYFFTRNSSHNRASDNGYWKPVGDDETVNEVGLKRTLVFYIGEAPEGIKTNWVMHEYHLSDCGSSSSGRRKRSSRKTGSNKWIICRVFEAAMGGYHEDRAELSCLDEVFLSLDDLDDVSC